MFVIGLDIGKIGAMAVVADANGDIFARSFKEYCHQNSAAKQGRHEQAPQEWWASACYVINNCIDVLKQKGFDTKDVISIAVSGTSGTVFLADKKGDPVTSAIIYDDARADEEAESLNDIAFEYTQKLGTRFHFSYGLPKILWLKKHMPDEFASAAYIMHPADYIISKLTGKAGRSDYSNALKSGYDILGDCFAPCVYDIVPDEHKLPEIYAPGDVLDTVSFSASSETGLSMHTAVCAGCTDGYASGLCSGTVSPGRWATILGNTFVVKGVTDRIVKDAQGRIYCHKHPDGYFMPSGMSNAGGRCLEEVFGLENLKKFDASVLGLIPTNILVYPLCGEGERFPFIKNDAKKFVIGYGNEREMYTAYLEGLSFVEKLAFETMEKLGCSIGRDVYAVGGSTKGLAWLKIRATVLNRDLHIPKETTPAMGSAMLAASRTLYKDLSSASLGMLQEKMVVSPYEDFVGRYERLYLEFKDKCSAIFSIDL